MPIGRGDKINVSANEVANDTEVDESVSNSQLVPLKTSPLGIEMVLFA